MRNLEGKYTKNKPQKDKSGKRGHEKETKKI